MHDGAYWPAVAGEDTPALDKAGRGGMLLEGAVTRFFFCSHVARPIYFVPVTFHHKGAEASLLKGICLYKAVFLGIREICPSLKSLAGLDLVGTRTCTGDHGFLSALARTVV